MRTDGLGGGREVEGISLVGLFDRSLQLLGGDTLLVELHLVDEIGGDVLELVERNLKQLDGIKV